MAEHDEPLDREEPAHRMGVADDAGERAGQLHHREPHDDLTPNTEPADEAADEADPDAEPGHGLPREPPAR